MSFISTVTIALSFFNILAVFLAGKYSTKHSYSSLFKASFVFALLGFGIITFTTTANGHVMFTIYRVFNLFFGAALGVSSTALIFSIVDEGERTASLAFKSVLTGLVGFVTTLVASPIMTRLQNANITLFGINIFAQQILAFISFCITALILVYYQFFCKGLNKN